MLCKYSSNPLFKVYNALNTNIHALIYNETVNYDDKPSSVIDALLKYNYCGYSEEVKSITNEIIKDDTYLYLIYGVKGNENAEVFDYVNIYGSKYIIVFMDYFTNIKTEPPKESLNIGDVLDNQLGNSVYFNAICSIVEFAIQIIDNVKPVPGSIQQKINSTAPTMIAANIINDIRSLEEADTDGSIINHQTILNLLNENIGDILVGLF